MNLLKKLERSSNFWFLLATSFIFFLFRLPSFFEPYWYGDEGVYEVLGFGMRHGRLLYQGVWDNKPPLLYLIYALFDGNQPFVRFFSFLVGLAAIYIFFALAKLLFEKKQSIFVATACFAIFLGLPLIEGNIANAENFMVLPTILAMYLAVRMIKNNKYNLLAFFCVGLLFGVSFLIKVVGVFDFITAFLLLGFVLLAWNKKALISLFVKLLVLSVGFFLPLVATIGFFASKGMLSTFIQSAFLSNVEYVNYNNQLFIPQGFLILKLLLVFIFVIFVFVKRKSLSLAQILLYLWIPFSLYNAFFSGRPYTHYVLVMLGSVSLLVGILFEKKLKMFHALLLIVTIALLVKGFSFYNKTAAYYTNFSQFILGQKSITSYQSFFDKGVPRDYAVADFLNRNLKPNQKVFLWTNSAQLYYLIQRLPLGRYTVAYHMTANATTLNETAQVLRTTAPDFIVVLPNASSFPFASTSYKFRVDINGGLIYEKVF